MSTRLLHVFVILCAFFVLACSAVDTFATVYYVRTDGNDGNSGTGSDASSAWQSVSAAAEKSLVPGDVVYVQAGTYFDEVRPSVDGSSGNPIQFIADTTGSISGWSAGNVILQAPGVDNVLALSNDDYLEFIGFHLDGDTGGDTVEIDDCTGIVLLRCQLYTGNHGVDLNAGSLTVKNCLLHNNVKDGFQIDGGTLDVWNSTIADNSRDGVQQNGGTATFTNCIVVNNADDGIDFNSGSMTHTYNLVFGNTTSDYSGTSASTGEISVDPLFVGSGDYHLQPLSPAIDAGTSAAGTVDDDLDSLARPQGAGWEMGCYEWTIAGHWKFDEGAGTTAADSSPLANDATLSGGTWTSDCSGNTALEFNGTGDTSATGSNFTPPSTGAVAFWMRGAGTPTARARVMGINGNWEIRQETTGKLSFDLGASPFEGNEPFATTSVVSEDDHWFHVVAQFNATDDSYEVYVDGELQSSGISPVDLVAQPAGILSFGTRTGSTEYWKGALRDVRVYDRWLSASEIATLSGLAGYWKLDETSGSVAADASVLANNGTYVNQPTLGATSFNPSVLGTAVQFDGTNDYIRIPHHDSMLADNGSVAFWFFATDINAAQGLLSKDSSGFDTGGHLTLHLANGKVSVRQQSTSTSYTLESLPVTGSAWHHVAFSWGSTGMVLYVDGAEVASNPAYTGGLGTTSGGTGNFEPMVLGANTWVSGDLTENTLVGYFVGSMDDARFYSRTLCPGEIQDLFNGAFPTGVRILKWVEVR